MQTCTECGHQNYDNERYCSKCGSQIKNLKQLKCTYCGAVITSFENNTCPQCGANLPFDFFIKHSSHCHNCAAEIGSDYLYCGMCGTETKKGHSLKQEQKYIKSKKTKIAVTLAICSIVCVSMIIGIAIMIRAMKQGDIEAESKAVEHSIQVAEESRIAAEYAEQAKIATYTKYTAQELSDNAMYLHVGDWVEVTGKLITRNGWGSENLEVAATDENEGDGDVKIIAYYSEYKESFTDIHAFGDTVTVKGRVDKIYPNINSVWVVWYEEVK